MGNLLFSQEEKFLELFENLEIENKELKEEIKKLNAELEKVRIESDRVYEFHQNQIFNLNLDFWCEKNLDSNFIITKYRDLAKNNEHNKRHLIACGYSAERLLPLVNKYGYRLVNNYFIKKSEEKTNE